MDDQSATIVLTPVDSSQISAIGYDPATRTLAVQFKGKNGSVGSTYNYSNVSQELYDEFMSAPSKGRFFKDRIKNEAGSYPFTKIA